MNQTCGLHAMSPTCESHFLYFAAWRVQPYQHYERRITVLGVSQDVAHGASTKVAQSLVLRARTSPSP